GGCAHPGRRGPAPAGVLAVAISARAPTAPRAGEDPLSRGLRTPPLPATHAPVGDCWQNSRCRHLLIWEEQHISRDTLVSHANCHAWASGGTPAGRTAAWLPWAGTPRTATHPYGCSDCRTPGGPSPHPHNAHRAIPSRSTPTPPSAAGRSPTAAASPSTARRTGTGCTSPCARTRCPSAALAPAPPPRAPSPHRRVAC